MLLPFELSGRFVGISVSIPDFVIYIDNYKFDASSLLQLAAQLQQLHHEHLMQNILDEMGEIPY